MNKKLVLILILSSITSVYSATPKLKGKITNGLWVDDLELREGKIIKKHPPGAGFVWPGFISPNGKKIIFKYELEKSTFSKRDELRIVDIDGKNEKILLRSKHLSNYSWSPDSKYIMLDDVDTPQIQILNPETGEIWLVKIPQDTIAGYGQPQWTKDGKSIYFQASVKNSDQIGLFKMDLNGNNFTPLIRLERGISLVSPNEQMVLFIPANDPDIHLMNIEGKGYRKLWKTKKFEDLPFWSPDSKWIGAQMRTNDPLYLSEYVARNIETGADKKLPIYKDGFQLQWWAPPTETPPNCEVIIREMLGEPYGKLEIILCQN